MIPAHSLMTSQAKQMTSACYLYRGGSRRGKRQDADIALLEGIPYEKNVGSEVQYFRHQQAADAGR
jgi:hypothetical protein